MIIKILEKKLPFSFMFMLLALCIFFVSCSTTSSIPEETPVVPEVEEPVDLVVEEKDDVPYDIAFATKLQELLNKGYTDEALAMFDTIPEEYADNANLNYLHASLLVSTGHINDADILVQELLAKSPDNLDLQFLHALVLKEQGKTRDSKKVVEGILKVDPTNIDANVELANTYMLVKNFRLANKHFVAGLRADPEDTASLFGHALTSWYLENDEVAKDALNKLVEVQPENSLAWAYLGKLSADKGRYEQAVEYMKTAISYEEDYYSHWLDLGSFYRSMNEKEEAEKAWSRAIEIDPTYFLGYAYRGGLRDEMKNYEGALSDYNNVVKYNPEYYYAYESIGMLYWKDKRWTESRNAFLRAYGANPRSTSYALLISATYLHEGKKNENQEFLKEAMRTVDRESLDYQMLRLYYDGVGESGVLHKVVNAESNTVRGRMLFYMAVFYEINGHKDLANKYHIEVYDMQAPMFFEFRFSEWAVEDMKKNNVSY